MYTEDEAKTRWCPQVRIAGDENEPNFNRGYGEDHCNITGGNGQYKCNCIASECMMWRWVYEDANPATARNGLLARNYIKTDKGHCGLAGRQGGL
jgi:hypothetical protein